MAIEQGYPITLVHPQHKAAKIVQAPKFGDVALEPGEPERYPAVSVNGAAQEAQYRALGYLRFGEPPPQKTDHHEFPKVLRHPEYVPAVEGRKEMRFENGRPAGEYTIPPVPAVMPDLTVLNEEQEAKAREAGYRPAGEYNRKILESFLAGTIEEETYSPVEYPKWVETDELDELGNKKHILIERDPAAPPDLADPRRYPMLVDGKIVSDPNVPPPVDPNEFPKWVHRDGIPGDASKLANNPIEEAAIRSVWAKEAAAEPAAAKRSKKAEPVSAAA